MKAPICWDCCCHHRVGPFFGRILIALIFLFGGLGKLMHYDESVAMLSQLGVSGAKIHIALGIIFELVGSILLILGLYTRVGVWILVIFLIPTTLIFHSFWTYQGAAFDLQLINFLKNLAIFGGLILVYCYGPGRWSVDARRFRHCMSHHQHHHHSI